MERYDPTRMERATRDVISRSSYLEIMAGRGTPSGGVYIDVSHLGADFVARNFPGMVERCADYGFDLLHDRVEVSPSAHYQMGGVKMDVNGRTNLEGLFVAGEDGGGVHGANRLGGNGVADSIVFGARAGDTMAEYAPSRDLPRVPSSLVRDLAQRWSRPLKQNSREDILAVRERLEDLMWQKVGVVRNGVALREAIAELPELRDRAERAKLSGAAASNPEWNEMINVVNLCLVGEMVARSAEIRKESRGAHYREEHPSSDAAWLKNIVIQSRRNAMEFSFQPVDAGRLTPVGAQATHANDLRHN